MAKEIPISSVDTLKETLDSKVAVKHRYADIASMIVASAQAIQIAGEFMRVTDASDDPNVTSGAAYYDYNGGTTESLNDYFLIVGGGGGVALVDGSGTKFNVDRIDLEDLDLSSEIRISNPEISGVARKGIKYWLDPVNSSVKLQAFEYDGTLSDREVADHSAYIDGNGDALAEMWAVRVKTGGYNAMIRAHLGYIIVGDIWSAGETGSFKGLSYHSYYDTKVDWANDDLLVPHQKRIRDMWLNSPIPFTPTFALNEKQEFQDYTLSANETWNASSVKGGFAIFDLITDGTFTVSEGNGFYVDYNNFFGNALPADTYRVQMTATSKGIDIQVVSTGGASDTTYIPYNIPNIIP